MSSEKRYPRGYGKVEPVADYRPWELDQSFLDSVEACKEHTKVDIYRLYELWHLISQLSSVPGDLVEVGLWRGGSAGLMGLAIDKFRLERHLWLADTFAGVVKAGPRDDYYKGGEHADTSLEIVQGFLNNLRLTGFTVLSGVFPEETAHLVECDAIALCHIDVDVYRSAKDVADWVWPRMPVGGILVYDDYGFYGCEGVTAFVNEEADRADRLVIQNLNGHAVVVKTQL
ncbi:MAG: TylF/MycF/NovP-related O-methyltransferase [Alkalispirochaetaceae bacterium]